MKKFFCTYSILVCIINCFAQPGINSDQFNNAINTGLNGFTENRGQIVDQYNHANTAVRYLLNQPGLNVQLKANSFSYDTYTVAACSSTATSPLAKAVRKAPDTTCYNFHRVDVTFPGAASQPVIVAENRVSGAVHYYTRQNKEVTPGIYKRVTYMNIYPKIDLVFDLGNHGGKFGFEYYFVIHPGGNPAVIQLQYAGPAAIKKNYGALELSVKSGTIKEHIPASYLLNPGASRLVDSSMAKKIPVSYRSIRQNIYGFTVPRYNNKQTLIIDPTPDLVWGTYYGSALVDWAYSIARDGRGNLFIGGSTGSTGLATTGAYQTTMLGYADAIMAKFTEDGKLVWATYYGGTNAETIWTVATDASGNVYGAGGSFSSDNIATPGAYMTTKASGSWATNAFLVKFDTNGYRQWATYYGGEWVEQCYGIAVDRDGNIVLVGGTASKTGIATAGAYQTNYSGGANGQTFIIQDVFLAKFNQAGQRLWGTYYGTTNGDEVAYGVAIDSANNIVIAGGSSSDNGFATTGAFQTTTALPGQVTPFIAKFTTGGVPVWCTFYGSGHAGGYATSVTADANNNIYAGGRTDSYQNIASPGAVQSSPWPNSIYGDGFIVKFNTNGQRQWGTYYGGSLTDVVQSITSDGGANIWVTGVGSPENIATPGTYQPVFASTLQTTFVAKFTSAGARLWGTYYGRGASGEGRSIVTDGTGNVYVCGQTQDPQNVATCGAVQPNVAPHGDMFVGKFAESPDSKLPSVTISSDAGTPVCPGTIITFTASSLNAGSNPVYGWKVNGVSQGSNSSTFMAGNLSDGDIITCSIIVNNPCSAGATATSNTLTVQVITVASPVVSIQAVADSICEGTADIFTATAGSAGANPSYIWYVNGTVVNSSAAATFTAQTLKNGDNVYCKVVKHMACSPDSTSLSNIIPIKVTTALAPFVTINVTGDSVCAGIPIHFTATAANAGNTPTYHWTINGNNAGGSGPEFQSSVLHNSDVVACVVEPSQPGCYTTSSSASSPISVTVYDSPDITISADTIITKGASTQLQATIKGNVLTYTWTPDSSLSSASITDPVARPVITTTYHLKVISTQGCEADKAITISVITNIKVPNAFSPNADGKNDYFKPVYGTDIHNVQFKIFNRWGQLVFEDNGTPKGWNGSVAGVPQQPGTYVWYFRYSDASGKTKVLKGTVVLVH